MTAQTSAGARRHDSGIFFRHLIQQQKEFWVGPYSKEHWNSRTPILMIGISAASFSLDGAPSRNLREAEFFKGLNDALDSTSANWSLAAYPLGFMIIGELTNHAPIAEYGWKSGEAIITAFSTMAALKAATRRARPHTGETYAFFKSGNSFPSGHSAAVWAVAAVTTRHFSDRKWIPWIVYPAAAVVSFSRVTSGHHFV
ncbi:MAG TPA: phosphatase PAP2 family protein, partial [Acidobacteriota bacterium]|nr:phosphatase PAP2 family protein [Acidobacteriota bacterium]